MRKKLIWALLPALPLAIVGFVYGQSIKADKSNSSCAKPYTCPLTGEQLPCSLCCPLNKQK